MSILATLLVIAIGVLLDGAWTTWATLTVFAIWAVAVAALGHRWTPGEATVVGGVIALWAVVRLVFI